MKFWRKNKKEQDRINNDEREEVKRMHSELQERLRVLQMRQDVVIARTRLREGKQ